MFLYPQRTQANKCLKLLSITLIMTSLFVSTTIYADSCEQKWAKYYAGKSWFEPWCDTESYKRKMAEYSHEEDDHGYNDVPPKLTRYKKSLLQASRISFSKPTYTIPKPCKADSRSNYTPTSCVDLFGNITFTQPKNNTYPSEGEDEINSVILKCNVQFTIKNNETKTTTKFYQVSTGNVFSEYIKENETRELQLFEVEFFKDWKHPSDKTRTRLVNGLHTINSKEEIKVVNGIDCDPIYAK
ncbi:hypothetical protein [Aeromonas salmonicida]|uniref:hypothetical protein n=1 Tax=Aeromonas salmonicida TaxID=645 RepID=UPI002116263B|nr:hypothetical protein [Aeromonas salmonicida]UUI59234.1 hypothetical protein NP805_13625 [Aeromonas salmonicida]